VPGAAWVVVVGEGCVGGQSRTAVHGIDVPGRIVWLSRGVHSGCKGAARGTLGRARTMKLRWRECAVGPPGVVAPGQGVHPYSLGQAGIHLHALFQNHGGIGPKGIRSDLRSSQGSGEVPQTKQNGTSTKQ
jgi:hypothetical protein